MHPLPLGFKNHLSVPLYFVTHQRVDKKKHMVSQLRIKKFDPHSCEFQDFQIEEKKQTVINMIAKHFRFFISTKTVEDKTVVREIQLVKQHYLRTDEKEICEDHLEFIPHF